MDRRLDWPQSRSGRGEQKNSQPLPGLEPPNIQPVAQRYTTELSRLLTSLQKSCTYITGWVQEVTTLMIVVSKLSYKPSKQENRDSSDGIALGYGLDDRGYRVRFPAEAGNFSLHHHVQNGSGAHPASYPMGARGFFPGGKAAEA
jgi:hypothetical protein